MSTEKLDEITVEVNLEHFNAAKRNLRPSAIDQLLTAKGATLARRDERRWYPWAPRAHTTTHTNITWRA
jgi:hypothetical protein